MKRLLFVLAFIMWASVASAQKVCTPVTQGVSQNCVVTLSWTAGVPSTNIVAATGFQVRRSDASGTKIVIGTVNAPTVTMQNTFTDAGNVNHCWDIIGTAGGAASSTPSVQQCWTSPALAPPQVAVPQGLTLAAISSSSIRVTYDDTPDETGFELWGRTARGNQKYALVASLPADTVTYDWINRKRYTAYCIEVRAKIGTFNGGFSDSRCTTTSK